MPDITRNLHSNTVAFACLEPQVATLINDVIHALACSLHWRQVSKSLLIEILSRLAESESFEMTHEEFASALWPYLSESARKEKFSKWLKKFKEDMDLSKCFPARVVSRRPDKNAKGQWRNRPTLYAPGHFWILFRAVQDDALKCDLLILPVRKRRSQVRAIVSEWLKEAGAVQIEREKKEQEKQKPASLPCKCACASCAQCAAKSATASEAKGAEMLRHIPNESFEAELTKFAEFFERYLREFGKIDKRYTYAINRAHNALTIAEQAASDLIVRNQTGHQLRLVGGRPK